MSRNTDDFVVGFEYKRDAERFLRDLKERLASFSLELHPDRTCLIEFGKFSMADRRARGEGRPETFDFLGFTHYCRTTRKGRFGLGRKPMGKRVNRTLKRIKAELRRRMHHDVYEVAASTAESGGGNSPNTMAVAFSGHQAFTRRRIVRTELSGYSPGCAARGRPRAREQPPARRGGGLADTRLSEPQFTPQLHHVVGFATPSVVLLPPAELEIKHRSITLISQVVPQAHAHSVTIVARHVECREWR